MKEDKTTDFCMYIKDIANTANEYKVEYGLVEKFKCLSQKEQAQTLTWVQGEKTVMNFRKETTPKTFYQSFLSAIEKITYKVTEKKA
ncbi:MAG: hypothetical protein AB8U25_07295 [Rickettsiales endosymbiont of Dermacentor nuttalli]